MNNFPADDNHVRALGRTIYRDNVRYLSWSCSGVEFVFSGTRLSVRLWTDWELDAPWKEIFQPWAAVWINGAAEPLKRFPAEAGTACYVLYESEKAETVTVRFAKLSEAAFSKLGIIEFSADGKICPSEPKSLRMEFIGDSITCGFGIESNSAEDNFRTAEENSDITYAALTAKAFGADFSLISWSTIGVWSSDTKDGTRNGGWIMPMLYDHTDIGIEGTLGLEPIPWDFGGGSDVVVINLGTNDASYTKGDPERQEEFSEAYGKFLRTVREKNPNACIVCVLGMMGNELFPAVEKAVSQAGDGKIFALELDGQLESDGTGSGGHPNAATHRKAAEKLMGKISELTGRERPGEARTGEIL
ncbi:MAG: GDSL-type esterase/lipase family protein [Prevotella sp.]|nr:GDSL-type esterase/lipase family protein [Prevotella sp.]